MVILLGGILLMSTQCSKKKTDPVTGEKISEMQQKVEEYAYFDLTTDISKLSENDKQLLPIFFEIGEIMDELFWEQTFGDKSILDTISDPWVKDYAMINYGAWDRLRGNKPFISGYGEKPVTANYYPHDITKEEFEAYDDLNKNSHYTVLVRDENNNLKTLWYHEMYKDKIDKV